jgi:Mn-containing catalase
VKSPIKRGREGAAFDPAEFSARQAAGHAGIRERLLQHVEGRRHARPRNEGGDWEFVADPQPAVDGGDGTATVQVTQQDVETLQAMAARTASDPASDPFTGADLGSGQAK